MTHANGRWVSVQLPDGTTRQDWIPDDQPAWPAPSDAPGIWHVVTDPGGASRWEWHERLPPPIPLAVPATGRPLQAARGSDGVPPTAILLGVALLATAVVGWSYESRSPTAEDEFRKTAQMALDAYVNGNFIGLQALDDPVTCQDKKDDSIFAAMGFAAISAGLKEIDLRVTRVEVNGDQARILRIAVGPRATELGKRTWEEWKGVGTRSGGSDRYSFIRRYERWYSVCTAEDEPERDRETPISS